MVAFVPPERNGQAAEVIKNKNRNFPLTKGSVNFVPINCLDRRLLTVQTNCFVVVGWIVKPRFNFF